MTMLGAISTASLGAAVKVGARDEELCFYSMVVMGPAERKSTVMKIVAEPLREIERDVRAEQAPRLREERSRKEMHENRRRELLRRHSKANDADDREALWTEICDADKQIAMFGPLGPFRLLADDITAEGLSWLLTQHGRIGIMSAEGSAIDNIVGGQYNAQGKVAKLDGVLRAYGGESITVDRRGRDSEHIDRALLSITLAIQPSYLAGLIDHSRSRDLGLVSRFVYVTPRLRTGTRHDDDDLQQIDPKWSAAWSSTLHHIHNSLCIGNSQQNQQNGGGNGGSVGSVGGFLNKTMEIISLSLERSSRERLRELHYELEPKLANELVHIADWAGRHLGRIVKVAGFLHLADRKPVNEPIDLDTFRRAEEIGDYLFAHGRQALEEPDVATHRARQVLEQWEPETITVRDLHQRVFHFRGKAGPAAQLAAQLTEEGLLEFMAPEKKQNGGRPAARYKINRENL